MIQSLDLGNTEYCNILGKEVDVLQLNGEEIWVIPVSDVLLLNVSSVYSMDTGYNLGFNIKAISDVTITFNDYFQSISAGADTQLISIITGGTEQVSGDLKIEGTCEFSTYRIASGSSQVESMQINEIKKWTTCLDYLPNYFWGAVKFNGVTDVYIPDNIKKIGAYAFLYYSTGTTSSNLYQNETVNIHLPKSLKVLEYPSVSIGVRPPLNATDDGVCYYIDNVCLGSHVSSTVTDYTVKDGTNILSSSYASGNIAWGYITNIYLNEDGALTEIPEKCFAYDNYLKSISIPASVTTIGNNAFNEASALSKLVIKTPAGVNMSLGTKLFYYKSARSMNVFTNNETVKNYNFAGDNVTATFYPLYMVDWIQLQTPTVTISGATLTITPVENATEYIVYSGTTELFRTTETTIDLAQYQIASSQYIYVQALGADGYLPSNKSTSVTLQAKQLSTPQISISDTILTITPVENATEYLIYKSETGYATNAEYLFTTTETTVDLTEYKPTSNSVYDPYYFYVVASDGGVNFANSYMSDFVTIHKD